MLWNRRCDEVTNGWRVNVEVFADVWRWCNGVSDVVDVDSLHSLRVELRRVGLNCGQRRLRFMMLMIDFVSNISSISVNVVSCVLHDLHTTVRQMNLVASVNSAVLLLLRVWKIISRIVGEAVVLLLIVWRWRFNRISFFVVVQVDSVDVILMLHERNWGFVLEFVVLNSTTVTGECRKDLRMIILLGIKTLRNWR